MGLKRITHLIGGIVAVALLLPFSIQLVFPDNVTVWSLGFYAIASKCFVFGSIKIVDETYEQPLTIE